MNLEQALEKLNKGEKIKLPEWTGYWYSQKDDTNETPAKIMVLTKKGDILDTPWIDKYSDRTDWEVCDGSLGFDFALLAMQNGKAVARRGWNGSNMFAFMRPADKLPVSFVRENIKSLPQVVKDYFNKWSNGETHYASGGEIMVEFGAYLCLKTVQNTIANGWQPSQTDMLANDWYLVQ